MGYSEYNYAGNAFYMAKHYFKMGKNNQQNGLAIDMGKYIEKGEILDRHADLRCCSGRLGSTARDPTSRSAASTTHR